MRSQFWHRHAVDISDNHAHWDHHWQMQCADLDSTAAQQLGREFATRITHEGRRLCTFLQPGQK